jgi:short-subunit dehydrogenase
LETRYGIRCLAIQQDLSEREAATRVRTVVTEHKINVRFLVNNAAIGPWGSFENTRAEVYEGLIQLNSATPISMCLQFMPDLISYPRSVIINVSSPAALQPVPYMAAYAASKSCLHSFSLALYAEWETKGVLVQTLMPGHTSSEFDVKAGAYRSALSNVRHPPSDVVSASLRNLERGVPLVTTAKGTYKQRFFAGMFPAGLVVRKVASMFRPPGDNKSG